MSSLQSNQTSKNLPTSLLLLHLLVTLVVECFLDKPFDLLTFLGSVAATIGASVIVIISYILLSLRKINKTGTYIFLAFQLMASAGNWGSVLVHYTDSYYILGILCGIVSNAFYIAAMLVLLNTQAPINPPTIQNNLASAETSMSDMSSIAFCPNCGNKIISEEHQFCGYCGYDLSQAKNVTAVAKTSFTSDKMQEQEMCPRPEEELSPKTTRKFFNQLSIPEDETILVIGKIEFNPLLFNKSDEIALTNKGIYIAKDGYLYTITLDEVTSIISFKSTFLQSVEALTITVNSGDEVTIRGITNAERFKEKYHEAYQNMKNKK